MITFDHVTFTYPDASAPALIDANFAVGEGEFFLVVGETGAGKSTLLRAVNGLVPHFTGGTLLGRVAVDGISTVTPPRELADRVGVVGQNPTASFVTDTVEDELAYAMENLGVAPDVMRRRVEDVLDLLGIAALRRRTLATLSSGEAQRVAIGSVLTASPRVLVLDEPTSALDPGAAEDVLAILTRLVDDLGLTVVLAEHRLERVVQYATRIAVVGADSRLNVGAPVAMMAGAPVAPPVVALARLAGWTPLPLSVRDARRAARPLLDRLNSITPSVRIAPTFGDPVARMTDVAARYGPTDVLHDVDFSIARGEIVAVMGRNGAGKSTLLRLLAGLMRPTSGRVAVEGTAPHALGASALVRKVGLVPPDPSALLYERTIASECSVADHDHRLPAGTTRETLDRIESGLDPSRHPRDCSEGQRLALALAVVLAPAPPLLLLDEPTRGLDYAAKARLSGILHELAAAGHAVVLATHDVELVAETATRAIVLADGEIVSDGPARAVVCHSPVFAPQVAKILAPAEWLTVAEVSAALGVMTALAASQIRFQWRSSLLLAAASVAGIAAFTWPLFTRPRGSENLAHTGDAPWVFIALVPLLVGILLSEIADGALDAKAVAMLGVLVACGAALRAPSTGVTGFTGVFFLLIPGGRVFGRGFGFVQGALTMFASALLIGGVGPWLPFEMLCTAWVGFFAGCLPRAQGRAELALLATYGAVAGLAYGLVMDMWFWPFGTSGTQLHFIAGAAITENLRRFWAFHLASALGFDIPRAVGNALLVLVAGTPVLAALRRAARRAAFGAPIRFDPAATQPLEPQTRP